MHDHRHHRQNRQAILCPPEGGSFVGLADWVEARVFVPELHRTNVALRLGSGGSGRAVSPLWMVSHSSCRARFGSVSLWFSCCKVASPPYCRPSSNRQRSTASSSAGLDSKDFSLSTKISLSLWVLSKRNSRSEESMVTLLASAAYSA